MNNLDMLKSLRSGVQREAEQALSIAKLLVHPAFLEMSTEIDVSPYGGSLWVTVNNRTDLELALSLAKPGTIWQKSVSGNVMRYSANIDEVPVTVRAKTNALPATCKIEKKMVEIPATPAYKTEVETIVCDF